MPDTFEMALELPSKSALAGDHLRLVVRVHGHGT